MASKTKASGPPSEEDFQAENDMRILIDAEKIKKDKKRLSRAKTKAKEQRDALSSVITGKKEA